MMKSDMVNMVYLTDALSVNVKLWSRKLNRFLPIFLTFDTGAVTTAISTNILLELGYDISSGKTTKIITASRTEVVNEIIMDKLLIGAFELKNVKVNAHDFPIESYSSGVVGLNVISLFNVNLLFDTKQIELTKILC